MNWILEIQNGILHASPALYPLMGIAYSLFASVHCSVMCSPLLPKTKPNGYFVGRVLAYTTLGLLLGGFGQSLRQSLEYELIAVLAFLLFAAATLSILGLQLFRPKGVFLEKVSGAESALFRGTLSAFIPCHLLYFFYSLAVLSGSFWGGGLILFGHAITSMPALSYGKRWTKYFSRKGEVAKKWVRLAVVAISLVNLLYFASRIFYSEHAAKSKVLFCF